jgi:hypothetical protein
MLHVDPAAVRDAELEAQYLEALGNGEVPWTTLDPAKNLATLRAQAMTVDQRWQVGFDHAFYNKGARGSLSDYPEYWEGRAAGRAAKKAAGF